jgi:hypothetical protein
MLLHRLYRSICSYCQAVSTHRPLAENQVTKPRSYTAAGSSLKGLLPDYLKGHEVPGVCREAAIQNSPGLL